MALDPERILRSHVTTGAGIGDAGIQRPDLGNPMKQNFARILRRLGLRKLAAWLAPESPIVKAQGGGGPGTVTPPPSDDKT